MNRQMDKEINQSHRQKNKRDTDEKYTVCECGRQNESTKLKHEARYICVCTFTQYMFYTHILDGSIEAPHHHLHTVRHFLGVSLKVQQDSGINWRDIRWSPRQPPASIDGT